MTGTHIEFQVTGRRERKKERKTSTDFMRSSGCVAMHCSRCSAAACTAVCSAVWKTHRAHFLPLPPLPQSPRRRPLLPSSRFDAPLQLGHLSLPTADSAA
ncbi:hypothetical protein TRVL_07069 [Trypanosoma vivax]|nr:hypothetical protein TRVL_07069 [Trypanosoma vivax]